MMIPDPLPVVCVALGHLSGQADIYISRLHGMLRRHAAVPFQLTCFSDCARRVSAEIEIRDCRKWLETKPHQVDEEIPPTCHKLHLFDAEEMPCPEFLYLDLSLVIRQNMTPLLEYAFGRPEDLVIVSDWHYSCYNSSVMRIRRGSLQSIYDVFRSGQRYPQRVPGDQDFIYEHVKVQGWQDRVALFPEGQIVSYKMTRTLNRTDSAAAQRVIENATVVKFHGKPKMHQVTQPFYNLLKKRDYSFFKRELRHNWRS